MRIALAQINPVVGDIAGNLDRVRAARKAAAKAGAELVVCPELVVVGYPPEDLIVRPSFAQACQEAITAFAAETNDGGPAVVLTTPWYEDQRPNDPRPIELKDHADPRPFNACVLIEGGQVVHCQYKQCLPNYGVFDEPRTFRAGDGADASPVLFRGMRLGFLICEDMWYSGPAASIASQGLDLFIAPHGSPFRLDAYDLRTNQAQARVTETGVPLLFVNQVGGQDELVFDGGAFVVQPDGPTFSTHRFDDSLILTDWEEREGRWVCVAGPEAPPLDDLSAAYHAAVLGTRDYVQKSSFQKVILGLSGGIDSAMVAAIAVDALGAENVHCIMMPSRYTSDHSLEDAKDCAERLGVQYDIVPIEPGVGAFTEMLAPLFAGLKSDVTEENIQSRLRGTLLMAMSNKFGSLLLTTGNKSEMAVGYATLYGDMNGAFNPLKDIYKTMVFELAWWRNDHLPDICLGPVGQVIPERIITKPPSAELREGQVDQDSLPPYDVLDSILQGLIEDEVPVDEIIARGIDRQTVQKIQRLLYLSEYKRRQAPPGPKISTRNFGRDRRYPIVNRWREGS